ncbi:MAG TPA: hypothetical protein VF221_23015 [Chloroflexota bacterium]
MIRLGITLYLVIVPTVFWLVVQGALEIVLAFEVRNLPRLLRRPQGEQGAARSPRTPVTPASEADPTAALPSPEGGGITCPCLGVDDADPGHRRASRGAQAGADRHCDLYRQYSAGDLLILDALATSP